MASLTVQLFAGLCLLSFSAIITKVRCVPINQFYPFGDTEGDSRLNKSTTTASVSVTLPTAVRYYGEVMDSIYVRSMQ